MAFDVVTRWQVFRKTGGTCHLTGIRLVFEHYGRLDLTTGWEIDHSVPRARGGTDHLNNLFPAVPAVNRSKQARPSRSVRAEYGVTRSPMGPVESARVRADAQETQIRTMSLSAAALGALFGAGVTRTPDKVAENAALGALAGLVVGGLFGSRPVWED